MKKHTVTTEQIDFLIASSHTEVRTEFDKVTVVSLQLPCGFVITESAGVVDAENYDQAIGKGICMVSITNKLWELECYALSKQMYFMKLATELAGRPDTAARGRIIPELEAQVFRSLMDDSRGFNPTGVSIRQLINLVREKTTYDESDRVIRKRIEDLVKNGELNLSPQGRVVCPK